jgi:2-dehydropantoate 2-reductase
MRKSGMTDSRVPGETSRSIAIVGAGALGSVFASALLQAGHSVTLLGRRATPDITVCDPPCVVQKTPLRVETDPSSVAGAEFVLMLVKAYDTGTATRAIAPYICHDATVVTLQNGLGNAAQIRKHLPPSQHVLSGVTSQAARRVSPGLILHTGEGPTVIGYDGDVEHVAARDLAAILASAGLPATATGDIDWFIWQKVAVNAAINGLTAVAGVPNGALSSRPSLLAAAEALADEAAAVAAAHGYHLVALQRTLRDTIRATAENRSSMLQDVEAGRRTEVDAIYGSLIAAGRAHGLASPSLTVIDALVRSVSGHDGDEEEPK